MRVARSLARQAAAQWQRLGDSYVHASFRDNPETLRRARLQISFGIFGAVFGILYCLFYLAIGHYYGVGIIAACSAVFGLIPYMLKNSGCFRQCGHLFALTLILGFTGLCAIEGGLHGHAIAWLASIPLCVLLLVEEREALMWSGLCVLTTLMFGICDLAGFHFPETYPPEWRSGVSAAGYAGLIPFMALLGLVFERTRRRSFEKLEGALSELSEANSRLVRLDEEKNSFLSMVSHDLKNPLGVISGYASLLGMLRDPTPEQVKEQSGQIAQSASRMLDLITNLLDIRAIEEGKMTMKPGRVSLTDLMDNLNRDYSPAAAKKNIQLLFELEPLSAYADRGASHQILDNMLSNAIKYSPPGSIVRIANGLHRDRVWVGIADQGPGLSEEDQAKLFKKFSRLTPRPTGGEGSTGLGLWIVQRLAESMGGEVWCQSQVGSGSTFGVALPAWTGAAEADDPAAAAPLSERELLAMFGFEEEDAGLSN